MAVYEVTTAVQYSTIMFYVVNTVNALCLRKKMHVLKKNIQMKKGDEKNQVIWCLRMVYFLLLLVAYLI